MASDGSSSVTVVEPYSVLAAGYDVVMDHVDYAEWASYVHGLIQSSYAEARRILELGCGTGSLALALRARERWEYLATDRSEAMLKVARQKAADRGIPIEFFLADFTAFDVDRPADVVILLYDGLNYLLTKEAVEELLRQAHGALGRGGVFIVDQTTPVNSEANEALFNDEGCVDGFHYVRRSRYDPETHLHRTRFDITVNGSTYREEHVQRAYTVSEIRPLIARSQFRVESCFAGLSRQTATDAAERIHWVLRKERE